MNEFLKKTVDVWHIQKNFKSGVVYTGTKNKVYAAINADKFQRVVDNLISNALKFSKDKDKVFVTLSQAKKEVLVQVRDQGVGIPKALLPDIFKSFSKAGRPGLRGEQSTGLGLSIVKHIVESHNGTIKVESEEGKGTTFTVTLPAVE